MFIFLELELVADRIFRARIGLLTLKLHLTIKIRARRPHGFVPGSLASRNNALGSQFTTQITKWAILLQMGHKWAILLLQRGQ